MYSIEPVKKFNILLIFLYYYFAQNVLSSSEPKIGTSICLLVKYADTAF